MATGTIELSKDEALVAALPPQQKEVTSVEATQEIAGYAGISFAELLTKYDGKLNIHLKEGQYVDVKTDAKRTLLLCLKAFLDVNEPATLDFFARLQVDNAKGIEAPIFPEQELVGKLAAALEQYRLRIRWKGQGSLEGDKYFDIGRSDRKKNLSSQVAHKEV
jgi:hypothetical protein